MEEKAGCAGPTPAIVGPRPEDGGGARKDIPRGMERLLTLAGISPEWRSRVLADPIATAGEAGIELSDSERSILRAVPPASISSMADSMAVRSGRPTFAQTAAGIAAAALLATNLTACGGSRPDVPRRNPAQVASPTTAPIAWLYSLDEALAKAKAENRGVMVVIPHPKPGEFFLRVEVTTLGHNGDEPNVATEGKSQKVVLTDSPEFRNVVRSAGLVAVRLPMPVEPPSPGKDAKPGQVEHARKAWKRHEADRVTWLKDLERCLGPWEPEIRTSPNREVITSLQKDLPAVAFLAPDGLILSVLRQPTEELQLLDAVKAVPPMLAKWMTDRREPPPPPPPTNGIRP